MWIYLYRSESYRFVCPSRDTKIIKSIIAKFFENDNFSGNFKITDIVFKEKRQAISVLIVFKRIDDASIDRNIVEPQPADAPSDPVLGQPIEADVEIIRKISTD